MRRLLVALAALLVLSIAGCSDAVDTITVQSTSTPGLPGTGISQAPTQEATDFPTPTLILPTRRAAAPTKTPVTPPPAPTRTDGIPLPVGATVTKNVPDDVRTFIQGQLKGMTRVGPAEAYLAPGTPDAIMTQYQDDLGKAGWESVPVNTGLASGAKLLVAQNAQIRAVIGFVSEGNRTLTYIVTTKK